MLVPVVGIQTNLLKSSTKFTANTIDKDSFSAAWHRDTAQKAQPIHCHQATEDVFRGRTLAVHERKEKKQ